MSIRGEEEEQSGPGTLGSGQVGSELPASESQTESPIEPQKGPEPERREVRRGKGPSGQAYVRIVRTFAKGFQSARPGYLVARESILAPSGGLGRIWYRARHVLIGPPISTALEHGERLTKVKALAIFSSDALSSVAYGPEEIMKVLVLAGAGALALTLPIAVAIAGLLAILITSYQQTIRAYPSGGGSYIVASDNLGVWPGLVSAAALLIDYTLTVAVSTAAGITALTSAFSGLYPYKLDLIVVAVALVMIANLRGVRESGNIFAAPAYVFIACIFGLVLFGVAHLLLGGPVIYTPPVTAGGAPLRELTIFLVLSAFAQGCSALTGVEAVANGVQVFKPPESRNAGITLVVMGVLLGAMVLGIGSVASLIGVVPDPTEQESVISQITRTLVGTNWFYYVLQFATMLILVLAANTSFAGFPRLASILAQDGFMPHQFSYRGDRLAFSTGVMVLAGAAVGLLVLSGGSVDRLIPLYAVGVFTAFTLSQAGMVQRWRRLRERGWHHRALVNGVGAAMTGIVVMVIVFTKFSHGAWMVVVLIPLLALAMMGVNRHYRSIANDLVVHPGETVLPVDRLPIVIVPVSRLDRPNVAALSFARSISPNVTAVHVVGDDEEAGAFRASWAEYKLTVPLVTIDSPYRALVAPLLAYIDAVDQHQADSRPITVVLASFVPRHWWEQILHNQATIRLRFHLLNRPNTIVVDVPYYVGTGFEGEARTP